MAPTVLANVVGVSSSRRVQVVPLGVVVPAEIGVNKGFQRLKKKFPPLETERDLLSAFILLLMKAGNGAYPSVGIDSW